MDNVLNNLNSERITNIIIENKKLLDSDVKEMKFFDILLKTKLKKKK